MNKVMLIGNVGKDPDVRYYDADQAVAQFPLATTERGYTLQNGTKVPDHTDWHNLVVWRGLAKVVEKHVHKGDKIYVEGRIRYRSYDDPKGQRRYVTEILVENMELLNPKPAEREENAQHTAAQSTTTQPSTPQPENEKQKPSATTATTANDEILPF
ncbi:MAG: single-stranded DNA-binding protein [Prevotella sp.]|uniref:single-stranded DNA-binding protein n=1 Tax=Segatella oulorum TaxID=28136 RepID=UPI000F1FE84E|nr:single-stranded DNA-binding protein [Prevotella sp.]RKW49812.1 MAG: single-stranded DNA-binding protein [Prevotella sp.]